MPGSTLPLLQRVFWTQACPLLVLQGIVAAPMEEPDPAPGRRPLRKGLPCRLVSPSDPVVPGAPGSDGLPGKPPRPVSPKAPVVPGAPGKPGCEQAPPGPPLHPDPGREPGSSSEDSPNWPVVPAGPGSEHDVPGPQPFPGMEAEPEEEEAPVKAPCCHQNRPLLLLRPKSVGSKFCWSSSSLGGCTGAGLDGSGVVLLTGFL